MAINLFGLSIPQISLPSLPKIEVPKIKIPDIPKIEVPKFEIPDIPKIEVPKIKIPDIPKIEVPKIKIPDIPKIEVPKFEIPKISLPDSRPVTADDVQRLSVPGAGRGSSAVTPAATPADPPAGEQEENTGEDVEKSGGGGGLPAFGGVSYPDSVSLRPPQGGNIIDVVIGARDQSYEAGLTHAFTGNVVGGGTQVAATAAFDMLLPLDALDVANKLKTGRGDELTSEDYLFAAIDTLGVAGSVFTLGGSYAASRALKAALKGGKVAIKGNVIGRVIRSTRGVGSSALNRGKSALNRGKDVLSRIKTPTPTKAPDPGDVSRIIRETREAQTKMTRQIDDLRDSLVKTFDKKVDLPTQLPNRLSKTGSALTGATMGAGGTAIALTLSGALGAPAPQQEEEGGGGAGGGAGGGLPGGDDYTGAGDDWWSEFINSLYDGGGAYDPSLYEGYDPYAGYYDPGYPDVLGVEPYAQDLLTYAEDIPVAGGVATAAKQSGFALPLIVGAIILVVLAVAFFRSKKGKAMVSGAKKKVSSAAKGAKKAVGA